VALLCACSGGGSSVRARAGGPRLVVLFSVCTLNREYLSPYNPAVPYTPSFERLAQAGVVFQRDQTEAGQSGTAFASLFSGVQADRHGIYTHPNRLDDGLYLMAEAFRDNGWDPWFWHGHPMASPDLNYDQGVPPEHLVAFKDSTVARLTPDDPDLARLCQHLADDPDAHAFIELNFSFTHGPYNEGREPGVLEAFAQRYPDEAPMDRAEMDRWFAIWLKDRLQLQWNFPETAARLGLSRADVERMSAAVELAYKCGIWLLDLRLGEFMDTLSRHGLLDQTLLAFTADHGQVLFRDSALFQWTHGLQLAPEVLNVPLIVSAPGVLAPGRYEGVTRSIDVYPTLAGLAGIALPADAGVEGVDLTPALLGAEPPPDLVAFSHSTTINPAMFGKTCEWTLFHALFPTAGPESLWVASRRGDAFCRLRSHEDGSWSAELYDLAADPYAEHDAFDAANPEHAARRAELEAYKARLVAAFRPSDPNVIGARKPGLVGRRALRKLQEMGYTEGDAPDEDGEDEPEPSPGTGGGVRAAPR
jgi:iduronate 2-sulfatase